MASSSAQIRGLDSDSEGEDAIPLNIEDVLSADVTQYARSLKRRLAQSHNVDLEAFYAQLKAGETLPDRQTWIRFMEIVTVEPDSDDFKRMHRLLLQFPVEAKHLPQLLWLSQTWKMAYPWSAFKPQDVHDYLMGLGRPLNQFELWVLAFVKPHFVPAESLYLPPLTFSDQLLRAMKAMQNYHHEHDPSFRAIISGSQMLSMMPNCDEVQPNDCDVFVHTSEPRKFALYMADVLKCIPYCYEPDEHTRVSLCMLKDKKLVWQFIFCETPEAPVRFVNRFDYTFLKQYWDVIPEQHWIQPAAWHDILLHRQYFPSSYNFFMLYRQTKYADRGFTPASWATSKKSPYPRRVPPTVPLARIRKLLPWRLTVGHMKEYRKFSVIRNYPVYQANILEYLRTGNLTGTVSLFFMLRRIHVVHVKGQKVYFGLVANCLPLQILSKRLRYEETWLPIWPEFKDVQPIPHHNWVKLCWTDPAECKARTIRLLDEKLDQPNGYYFGSLHFYHFYANGTYEASSGIGLRSMNGKAYDYLIGRICPSVRDLICFDPNVPSYLKVEP